jgi:hypothetical protein
MDLMNKARALLPDLSPLGRWKFELAVVRRTG